MKVNFARIREENGVVYPEEQANVGDDTKL
jgi:hypothetical protein